MERTHFPMPLYEVFLGQRHGQFSKENHSESSVDCPARLPSRSSLIQRILAIEARSLCINQAACR
jgi:hypothetical protein